MRNSFNEISIPENKFLFESQYHFKRSEKKYLINSSIAELLIGQIGFYLPKDEKTSKSPFISSIYYDSCDWKCYKDQINKVSPRFKIRFRQYTKDGTNSDKGFLEIKRKINSLSVKDRLKVNIDFLESITDDHIPDEIKLLNKKLEIEKINDIYFKIVSEIKKFNLHPVARVSYSRQAFENQEKTLRVTFNSNLKFYAIQNQLEKPITPSHKFSDNIIVMKIMYANKMPEWLFSLLKINKISKQQFSKYCNAINYLYSGTKEDQQQNIGLVNKEDGLMNYGNAKKFIFN
ncbi:MAG: polyphosphate polymerase domain-containing protein [Ignavibacteriaceae bacterium]